MKTTQPTIRLKMATVQALREVRDLDTDKALAAAMGVNQSSVSRVLRGVSQPGPRFIAGLCHALGEPMHKLFVVEDREAA